MICRLGFVTLMLCGTLLAGCYRPGIAEVELNTVKARNGDVADACLDTRITSEYSGYIDFSALPSFTKADFDAIAPDFEDWADGGKDGIGKRFYDNHSYEAAGQKLAPMRRCWNDGDPRNNGLRRYRLSLVGTTGEGQGVSYWLYFDDDLMVYAEGWTRPYTSGNF